MRRNARPEGRAIEAGGGEAEADLRAESLHAGVAAVGGHGLEDLGRPLRIAPLEEQRSESHRGAHVLAVRRERRLEVGARTIEVARRAGLLARLRLEVGARGEEALEEGARLRLGHRSDELLRELAVPEGHHVGDALDLELAGDARVLVGVQLHELNATGVLLRQPLEDGADDPAGPAPGRPEVDDDRQLPWSARARRQ
ncbi:MAG: hypothetical protein U0360_09875 [Dehalococcoidia bacterium]